jgi:hypothetical protein
MLAALIAALTLLLIATSAALAISTIRKAHAVTAVQVVTEDNIVSPGVNWTDVPSMSLSMNVPTSQKALFLATFSAETDPDPNPCWVRMLINGAQMPPGQVMYASQTDGWTSNSNQFLAGPYPTGTYTFTVQFMSSGVGANCNLRLRTLSILRAKV